MESLFPIKIVFYRILEIAVRLFGFIGIPVMVCFGLISFIERDQRDQSENARIKKMEEALSQIALAKNPQQYFNNQIMRLVEIPFPSKAFNAEAQRLFRENQSVIELICFDVKANPIAIEGIPLPHKYSARHFMQALLSPDKKTKSALMIDFGGTILTGKFLSESPEKLLYINMGGKKTWGGWWKLIDQNRNPSGHLIAFVNRMRVKSGILLDQAISKANIDFRGELKFAWQDPVRPETLRPNDITWKRSFLKALNRIPVGRSNFDFHGLSTIVRHTEEGEILVCQAIDRLSSRPIFSVLKLSVAILGAGISGIFLFFSIGAPGRNFGIRAKLIVLFMVGIGVPLILLVVTAIIDRVNQEALLIDNFRRVQLENLMKIDEGLFTDYQVLAKYYLKIKNSLKDLPSEKFNAALTPFREWIQKQNGLVPQAFIVDTNRILLFYDDKFVEKVKTRDFSTKEMCRLYGARF